MQTLHRKGVHCMEVIEREECAVSNFEAVLDERTSERALVTDALLRLVKIYRKSDNTEGLTAALRRYWDVGMGRKSTGHVPYSVRFFPSELDVFWAVDIQQVVAADVIKRSGENTAGFIFTCDSQERNDIRNTERWRRAELRAKSEGRETYEVLYEDMDEARIRREKFKNGPPGRRSDDESDEPKKGEPIFSTAMCELAKALGEDSLAQWRRFGGAMNHKDFKRSVGVADIPDLDQKIAWGLEQGTLREVTPTRWILLGTKFADQNIELLKFDRDELVIARTDMVTPLVAAATSRKRKQNRDVKKLIDQVPRDSGFMLILSRKAIEGLSFGAMKQGRAAVLQALLPKPKGLQVSGAFSEYAGLFTRMPTDNPVKAKMLAGLANRLLDGNEDPETSQWLENLDVAEASDKRALLATYILGSHQLGELLYR